jgi:hypothetical protein
MYPISAKTNFRVGGGYLTKEAHHFVQFVPENGTKKSLGLVQ